jgi:hypothetical protein
LKIFDLLERAEETRRVAECGGLGEGDVELDGLRAGDGAGVGDGEVGFDPDVGDCRARFDDGWLGELEGAIGEGGVGKAVSVELLALEIRHA